MPKYTVQEFLLTYGSWQSLRQRCVYGGGSRKDHAFYRGRGITVCERWMKFENFIEDMGPRPGKEFSLDRFPDKDGNYEPGNCRWATALQQSANTRSAVLLTYAGETLPIAAWGRKTGLGRSTIQHRLKAGWGVEKALTVPTGTDSGRASFSQGLVKGQKLTASQVKELVRLARTGKWTATALGKKYGVSTPAVCHVAKQFNIKFKKGRPKL